MVGRTVSHYRIVAHLGTGGMGVVYKAEDTRLGRLVALKFLPEHLASDRHALSRLQGEARAASALNHPHICTIYDIDAAEGRSFIAMELLEGEPLRLRLRGRPLETPAILNIVGQLADALEAAHAKGIVHRDIKPENIFLSTRGTVKLLDFGIAKLVAERTVAASAPTATRDATGALAGTIAYMSPEQLRGDTLDGRTDLFSLGVVLYELMTGVHPFAETGPGGVVGDLLTSAPPPAAQRSPGIPPELGRIVTKLLEKDRRLRYQSATELRIDLERFGRMDAASRTQSGMVSSEQASIVVLPFDNLSPDPDNAFFADGLTEEIIADLSKVRSLRVISRTSAMLLRDSKKDVPTIARQMNVRYVLEGSVRRAANNLRITAQLIDTGTDAHLWAEKYSGTLDDVFEMQERVSRAIVDALRLNLTPEEHDRMAARPLTDIAAYDCYLRARHEIWSMDEASLGRAIDLAQQGLRIVGENELLYAAMGMAYCRYANVGIRPEASLKRADQCAAKIAALNGESSHAYLLRGVINIKRGNMQQGVRELKRFLAADPNDPEALRSLGYAYLSVGKPAAARPFIRRLLDVDPLTFVNHCLPGWADNDEGRWDEAVDAYRACYEMAPDNPLGRGLYGWVLAMNKRFDEALPILDSLAADLPDAPLGRLALCLARALRHDKAGTIAVAESLTEAASWDDYFSARLAECYALVGEKGEALRWLENADRLGVGYHVALSNTWVMSSLHDDGRFQELIRRMKERSERFEV
ncbi:MAG TPA: protein kinase [Vicinamibacterales bacterium]|nr:protein kinase [Vicinamibacterales bacterium]